MRRSRRLRPYVLRLRRMAADLAGCPVTVTQEPGHERPLTIFNLERPLPWQAQDDLCMSILGTLGDWCREHWIEPTFLVYGPRIGEFEEARRMRARPRRLGARPARAR